MAQPISGHTKLFCLLGSPAAHSISPKIQNTAFDLMNLDCRYLAFDVGAEQLSTALDGLKALGFGGCNITMPNKNKAAGLVDELSPAARISGAVNTIVNQNGRLIGHTTDGAGWVSCARAEGFDPVGKHIVQLGAGGAGTAVLVQAALDGAAAMDVFNARDSFWPRLQTIGEQLNAASECRVTVHDLADPQELRRCIQSADILLNTTPVGMSRIPGCLIPDESYFHSGLVVSDIIYEPRETQLLQMARQTGLKAFNGLYMLLYQGAASFRLWTGLDMPVSQIRSMYFTS